jgi:hypothetical protein
MMRFIWMFLALILSGGAGKALTPIDSFFRSFSETEAKALQQKLAVLPPAEFLSQLQSQISPEQPPLWLSPYTEPVIVYTFRLLTPERAAELLPMLWKLNDVIVPEEKVLFAAACFQALPEREKHPEFARRLDRELKALIATPLLPGDGDDYLKSALMGRAVGSLAGLWTGSDDEREWIKREANNSQLPLEVRFEIIERLSEILSPQEQEDDVRRGGLFGGSRLEMLRDRQVNLPKSDRERLRKAWGPHDWAGELLIPMVQSPEQPPKMSDYAIWELQKILGAEERLRTLLLGLARSDNEHPQVRLMAIGHLLRIWGKDESLKPMLMKFLMAKDQDPNLRRSSIQKLAEWWKEDASVRESLAAIVALTDDQAPVQKAALEALTGMGRNDCLRQCMLKTAVQVKADWSLRKEAVAFLGTQAELDPAAKNALVSMVEDRKEQLLVRQEAIRSLTRVSKKDGQIRQQLTALMQSAQEDEKVRIACFEALGLVWERKNDEWVKDLLMPLVGPQEKSVALRAHILWFLPQIWKREPWLEELFKGLATSHDEPDEIRAAAMRTSYWCKEEWFKGLIIEAAGNPEQSVTVRKEAAQALTHVFRGEPWVMDLLLPLASSPAETPELRQQVILAFDAASWVDTRFQNLLMSIAADSNDAPLVRRRAMLILTRKLDPAEAELVMKTATSSAEEPSIREEAIDVIGRAWGPITWKEKGEFLTTLSGPEEKNKQVRAKAAHLLRVTRAAIWFGN